VFGRDSSASRWLRDHRFSECDLLLRCSRRAVPIRCVALSSPPSARVEADARQRVRLRNAHQALRALGRFRLRPHWRARRHRCTACLIRGNGGASGWPRPFTLESAPRLLRRQDRRSLTACPFWRHWRMLACTRKCGLDHPGSARFLPEGTRERPLVGPKHEVPEEHENAQPGDRYAGVERH
jgi:hypothetical protein